MNRKPDCDPFDPDSAADTSAEYARLRETCPVPYADRFGGFWTLTHYEDVRRAALDYKQFPSGRRTLAHVPDTGVELLPLVLNPPDHAIYRRALNPHFGPDRIKALEPAVRGMVVALLEPLLLARQGDIVADFASILPLQALCHLLNMSDALERMRQVGERLREVQARAWWTEELEKAGPPRLARQPTMVLSLRCKRSWLRRLRY